MSLRKLVTILSALAVIAATAPSALAGSTASDRFTVACWVDYTDTTNYPTDVQVTIPVRYWGYDSSEDAWVRPSSGSKSQVYLGYINTTVPNTNIRYQDNLTNPNGWPYVTVVVVVTGQDSATQYFTASAKCRSGNRA